MDIKSIIGILNRPWFLEPRAAQQYAEHAAALFRSGSVPSTDRRWLYSDSLNDDTSPLFRVNKLGVTDKTGEVQVIRINYPIAKYDLCGDPGTQSLQQIIHAANSDTSIQSIVLWFDSPGGQVDGTEALATTIENSEKPIVSYCDYMLCSAAYWLACSTKEIIVHGANNGWNAVIGSIGTMCYWEDLSGKYEKEGIKVHTVFATKSKDKWADYFKQNSGDPDAYDKLRVELDGINNSFLSAVRRNRKGKLSEKEDTLTGKTYNATDALAYGLIDKIEGFHYAVSRAVQLVTKTAQNQNLYSMKFPKTAAAAKADQGFEQMNEGLWMSHNNLENLEQTLADSEETAAASQQAITSKDSEITRLNAENERLNGLVTTLQGKVDSLETSAGKTTETVKEEDRFDNDAKSQKFAHNEWADQQLGR